jgi:hypothetical protein
MRQYISATTVGLDIPPNERVWREPLLRGSHLAAAIAPRTACEDDLSQRTPTWSLRLAEPSRFQTIAGSLWIDVENERTTLVQ